MSTKILDQVTLDEMLDNLNKTWRLRADIQRTRIKLTNQIKAVQRRMTLAIIRETHPEDADKLKTHEQVAAYVEKHKIEVPDPMVLVPQFAEMLKQQKAAEDDYDNSLEAQAEQLPHVEWFTSFRGFGLITYAKIIAETGDLHKYDNPAKVWARMGLGVVEGGRAQKNYGTDEVYGYSKRRRTVMYLVADSIVKQGRDNKWRKLYDKRKAYELERDANGYNMEYVHNNKERLLKSCKSPANRKRIANGQLPLGILDKRAMRYAEKAVLKELWKIWNKNTGKDVGEYQSTGKTVSTAIPTM